MLTQRGRSLPVEDNVQLNNYLRFFNVNLRKCKLTLSLPCKYNISPYLKFFSIRKLFAETIYLSI